MRQHNTLFLLKEVNKDADTRIEVVCTILIMAESGARCWIMQHWFPLLAWTWNFSCILVQHSQNQPCFTRSSYVYIFKMECVVLHLNTIALEAVDDDLVSIDVLCHCLAHTILGQLRYKHISKSHWYVLTWRYAYPYLAITARTIWWWLLLTEIHNWSLILVCKWSAANVGLCIMCIC